MARQWPPYLDPAFKNNRGVWDPDRWHLERKRGETPVQGEARDEAEVRKEGPRKERGGGGLTAGGQEAEDLQQLVLSPQRRSFLSGCTSGGGGATEPEVKLVFDLIKLLAFAEINNPNCSGIIFDLCNCTTR